MFYKVVVCLLYNIHSNNQLIELFYESAFKIVFILYKVIKLLITKPFAILI